MRVPSTGSTWSVLYKNWKGAVAQRRITVIEAYVGKHDILSSFSIVAARV